MDYNKKILTEFDTFFALFHDTENVFKETIQEIVIPATPDDDTLIRTVYLLHFPKMLSLAQSSIDLIKSGFKLDSDILIRSFFETYVNLRYVENKPRFRARLFQLSELNENIGWKQYIVQQQKSYDAKNSLIEKIKALHKEREGIISDLMNIDNSYCGDYTKFLWKKISMEDRSKDIGMEHEYKFVFSHLSESVHISPNTTGQLLDYSEDKITMVLQPIEDYNMIPEKITLIIEYLLNTLIFIEINIKLHLEDKVKPLISRY